MIICRLSLVRMRKISDKICRENQNTYFMFNYFFLIMPLMRQPGNILYRWEGHRWQ